MAMEKALGRAAVYALYSLHILTLPLDRYFYVWRAPSYLGIWYLRAYMRWYR